MRRLLNVLSLGILFVQGMHAQDFKATKDLKPYEGFFDFYYDEGKDRILLVVGELEEEFLYMNALRSGIGSNDIGLDRGKLGGEAVVYFKKTGPKLMLVQPNLDYRAYTDNELEKRSVKEAFAQSVIHGFPILEESEGHYLIDLSDFLKKDSWGVAQTLKRTGQGSYSVDKTRSALSLEYTRSFPKNSEFDAMLTFKGTPSGYEVRSVTPDPSAITVYLHHSFVQLPDDKFEPRAYDPRCGSFAFDYYDYSAPVEEPTIKRFITRHRLEKKDPSAPLSEAVEPIVYYLDNGTPEPVRSALLEGARWWNQAFESIGYKDAFQVKVLPSDADPLDIRYNVIQWVHRSTRGWSYGASIVDPRTGEILKGHVSLGSLRIRQDFLIAQALMKEPYKDSNDNHGPMLELALARIRQLSAHEVGHTLGFSHNFAASTVGRASVMDYPHPLIQLKDGEIDFSDAYDTGIGAWDKVTIAYSYSDFPEGTNETEALSRILQSASTSGLRYITDADARATGGAHALAHLWDNGKNAYDELGNLLNIREKAIVQFSEYNIPMGRSLSDLEDVFVPLYFFHRYQTEATTKLIGGLDYNYALRGDSQPTVTVLDREQQQLALSAVLQTLSPEVLVIPQDKLKLFPPRAPGFRRSRESFPSKAGVAFDPFAIAETAADFSLSFLLHPQRANRLVSQKAMDSAQLGLEEVVAQLLTSTLYQTPSADYAGQVQKLVNYQVLEQLMELGKSPEVYPQVTETVMNQLKGLMAKSGRKRVPGLTDVMKSRITPYLKAPQKFESSRKAGRIPDGSPIGQACSQGPH